MKGPAVLRHQDFKRLWLGQAVSQFGDAMYFLLVPFVVQKLTSQDQQVGLAIACQGIPFLLFSVWAGALADRLDRRLLMLFSDFGSAAVLVAAACLFWLIPNPPVVILFATAFFLAFLQVFFMPAKSASIPRLVPAEELLAANSLSATTQQLMPLIGLSLSALVLAPFSSQSTQMFFVIGALLNAASFVISGLYILRLPVIKADRSAEEPKHPLTEAREGLRYVMERPVVWIMVMLSFALNLIVSPFMVVYTSVNKSWFGGSYQTFAMLEVGFMLGLLVGAVFSPRVKVVRPAATSAVTLLAVGAMIALFVFARNYAAFWVLNFLAGVLLPIGNLPMQTYVQRVVDDRFMGRVQSVFTMVSIAIMPFGALLGGYLLTSTSPEAMFLFMGFGMMVASAAALCSKTFRDERMPSPQTPELGEVPGGVAGSSPEKVRPSEDGESGDAPDRETAVS